MKLNQERLKQQMAVSKAIDDAVAKKKAKEYVIVTTRDANEPNKPSGKGGYKKRSTKRRRRRSTKKRRRTMRR